MSASNETELQGRTGVHIDWALFDAAPAWLRAYLAFHPYNVTLDRQGFRLAQYVTAEFAHKQLSIWRENDREMIAAEARRLYGPDHPQAQVRR